MSPFFDDLEAQLHAAARGHAAHRHSPVASWRRHLGGGVRVAALSFAIAVTFAVAAVVLTLSGQHRASNRLATRPAPAGVNNRPPASSGHPSPQNGTAAYINAAQRAVVKRDPACQAGPRPGPQPQVTASKGAPSRTLLAVLGVLRRPGKAAAPQFVSRGIGPNAESVYVNYIRLARVEAGRSYYVVPEHLSGPFFTVPVRCFAEEQAALVHLLPLSMPARKRSQILRTQEQVLARERDAERGQPTGPYDGVALFGGGAGFGVDSASQLEHQGLIGSVGATALGIVPDGVANVELTLPTASGKGSVMVTAPVINNVFIANEPAVGHAIGMVWLRRDGSIVKRFNLDQ